MMTPEDKILARIYCDIENYPDMSVHSDIEQADILSDMWKVVTSPDTKSAQAIVADWVWHTPRECYQWVTKVRNRWKKLTAK